MKTIISTPTGEIDASLLESIPPRTFRNSWRLDGSVITIDMEAAREIHKGRMRAARERQFRTIDAQRAVAMDDNDQSKLAEIKTLSRELRDVTSLPSLLSAATPDEIDAVWPECLGPR